jgi:L-arabinonolactonase
MPKEPYIECVIDAKAQLGEGPCWDWQARCLWWVDIHSKLIHRYDPLTGSSLTFSTPAPPGCVAVRQKGGLIVAMGNGFYFFDPPSGQFTSIVDVEAELSDTRMNDGKTDRQGRFWSGTMFESQGRPPRSIGSLYRLDGDLSFQRIVEGITCSNGLAWSPDSRTMYFADSATPYVWAWDFDASHGDVENRRIFIDLSSLGGVCDGATVDAEGCYWLAMPFKGKVQRYDPAGKLMQTISLPTDIPTCCEFGGKDLNILYITTAALGRSPAQLADQPAAGGVFAVDVGVKGLPACQFQQCSRSTTNATNGRVALGPSRPIRPAGRGSS